MKTSKTNDVTRSLKKLSIALAAVILAGCGGGGDDRCDKWDSEHVTTQWPNHTITFQYYWFDGDDVSGTWTNTTSGESGTGEVYFRDYGCFILLGCGYYFRFRMDVPLVRGENTIKTKRVIFDNGREVECRKSTYFITTTAQFVTP